MNRDSRLSDATLGDDESNSELELDRRTLTKLAGAAGVAALASGSLSGVVAADIETKAMNIDPVSDLLLIQPVETSPNTASGVSTKDGEQGIVRAVGDEVTQAEEGEKVLHEDGGIEIEISGEDHRIISEAALFAVIAD